MSIKLSLIFFPQQRNVYKSDKISFNKSPLPAMYNSRTRLHFHTLFHKAVVKPHTTHTITVILHSSFFTSYFKLHAYRSHTHTHILGKLPCSSCPHPSLCLCSIVSLRMRHYKRQTLVFFWIPSFDWFTSKRCILYIYCLSAI